MTTLAYGVTSPPPAVALAATRLSARRLASPTMPAALSSALLPQLSAASLAASLEPADSSPPLPSTSRPADSPPLHLGRQRLGLLLGSPRPAAPPPAPAASPPSRPSAVTACFTACCAPCVTDDARLPTSTLTDGIGHRAAELNPERDLRRRVELMPAWPALETSPARAWFAPPPSIDRAP